MEEIINKIIEQNKEIFGDINSISNIEKINVGFTNTIYIVDNKYVVKICSNLDNENSFKKEIEFYKANKDNDLIPKLYCYNIDKEAVPYCYEIIEKIEGTSLYNVWHKLSENEREDIIKQLCDAMRMFHNNKGEYYDWAKKTKEIFMERYNKTKEIDYFSKEEQELLEKAYSRFDEYLKSDEIVLVHNDLHFDNIFYNEGKIKLIDFERSVYAPKDFEFNILYFMIRKPWKFASEETEEFTKVEDYENIMQYIEKYYPELINIENLYKRLAIYDIVYELKHCYLYPDILETKEMVLEAVNKVLD